LKPWPLQVAISAGPLIEFHLPMDEACAWMFLEASPSAQKAGCRRAIIPQKPNEPPGVQLPHWNARQHELLQSLRSGSMRQVLTSLGLSAQRLARATV
jgi:hypothetical protein